jgi:hypothetical protein
MSVPPSPHALPEPPPAPSPSRALVALRRLAGRIGAAVRAAHSARVPF